MSLSVHRKDSLRASKIMQERAFSNKKIKFIWNTEIEEILGDIKVKSVKLKNINTKGVTQMPIDGVFVAIGHMPNSAPFKDALKVDKEGYIITKEEVKTDIDGVFVAGDVADKFYRQAATAASSGVKAALHAREYLSRMKF